MVMQKQNFPKILIILPGNKKVTDININSDQCPEINKSIGGQLILFFVLVLLFATEDIKRS